MHSRLLRELPSRPLLALLSPSLSTRRAFVHASPTRHHTSLSPAAVDTMLSRAKKDYEKSKPAAQPTKADLKKELFPSSSPAFRDGSIVDYTSRPSASSASWKAPPQPLKPKTDNIARRQAHSSSITSFAKPTQGFSSLYNRSDSFQDEPVPASRDNSQTKTVASTFFTEDDFSDDDTLELDYQCPASLPPPPPPPKAAAQNTPSGPRNTSPASSTKPIAWTSSPAEHFYPPSIPRPPSFKREPPNDEKPAPKRRKLPASYGTNFVRGISTLHADSSTIGGLDAENYDLPQYPTSFPAKSKSVLWDSTYSDTAEKKKQLKNRNKKPESQLEYSAEDMQTAIMTQKAAHKPTSSVMSLSSEQQRVLELVVEDKQSVFFTGPAGTGKSVLMRAIIAAMKKKWTRDPERLSITASTGLAACNIGGMTLHSFAGIGLGKEDVPTLVKKIRRNPKAKNRWLRTRTLIIDEISMVDGELFDKLAQIARQLRNNGRPWGGIQLVITGDFFQLPPVPDRNKRDTKFAFDAATWNTSIDHTIGLTQVFRQRDHHFADMLNEMRLGRVSNETVQAFKNLSRPLVFDDGLDATELFPTRFEVERANDMRLRALPHPSFRFDADDSGDPQIRDKLLENMMAPKTIELKKGAQVMCIKNMDDTLVNGSLGKVRGFMSEAFFDQWKGDGSDGVADEFETDFSAKRKIKAFARESSLKDMKEYPVVQFTCSDGSHRTMLVVPEEWKVELPNGEIQAKRTTLPLILAWALSIHKAQGQTLERVKVDLGKVFEKGQAYVALSRATTQEGLQVLRFEKSKVMAHPRVIQFYNQLYSAESVTKKAPATISDFALKAKSAAAVRRDVEVIALDDDEEAMAAAYG